MNLKKEHKNDDNNKLNKNEKDINNTDLDEMSNKSHKIQRPLDILLNNDKNRSLNIFRGNDSRISLETFKTMFKNKNKELKEYKESLDKKIELLKNKINLKNALLKGRNKKIQNIENGSNKLIESTLKDININNSPNKRNYGDSLLFTLKSVNNQLKKEKLKHNISSKTFSAGITNNIFLNYNSFYNSFFKSKNHQKNLFNLLSLLNSNDLFKIFNINKSIKEGIKEFLINETKEKIIKKFLEKYCQNKLFTSNKYDFKIIKKQYKKNKKAHVKIILNIKANISENNLEIINKKHQILFQILKPKKITKSTYTSYSFEIIQKYIPKKFWIYKEYTSFHYDEHDKSYYNDLLQFWPGDQILINIGLITELGILDFDNFHWLNPKIVPKIKKISNISIQSYLTNSESTCEVEGIVNSWSTIDQLDNYQSVIKTLNDLFGKYFLIKEVLFEDVGYYFFKVILQAKNKGECNGINNNLGICIKINGKEEKITNEIKKNGLIYDEKNELTINIDDIITFYISQNK